MEFRKFKQEKLWRDKAVERLEKDGSRIQLKKLNDEEFAHALKDKLREEAAEVAVASDIDRTL